MMVKMRFRQGKSVYSSSVPLNSDQGCVGAGATGSEVEMHPGQVDAHSHLRSDQHMVYSDTKLYYISNSKQT